MNLFFLVATTLSGIVLVANAQFILTYLDVNRVPEPYEISRKSKALYSDLGIVKEMRQCGGHGKAVQWRTEACPVNLVGPCLLPAGQAFRGELTFIPSESSESLGVRSIVKDRARGLDLKVWQDSDLKNSAVEAGKEYTLTVAVIATPEYRGQVLTGGMTVYRESDKEIEVCAEADFYIV